MPKSGLSRRERQIMDVLYRRGTATVNEVMDDLTDPPSYSAVRATLRILEDKGHVKHTDDAGRYVYLPTVSRKQARLQALKSLVGTFFDGSIDQTVVALLSMRDGKVSAADLARLREEIRKAEEDGR